MPASIVAELAAEGVVRGGAVGLAVAAGIGVGLAAARRTWAIQAAEPVAVVAEIEHALHPRWTWWARDTADALIAGGLRVGACWDVDAVHQLLAGGSRPGPAVGWARLHDLAPDGLPRSGQLDLLGAAVDGDGGDAESPVRPDGYLRPEWLDGGWRRTPQRLAAWAALAVAAADGQRRRLAEPAGEDAGAGDGRAAETPDHVGTGSAGTGSASTGSAGGHGDPLLTAWSESAAELLGAELQADGLPIDLPTAHGLVRAAAGDPVADEQGAADRRRERDALVLRHAREPADLRNPAQVRAMLARVGIDVPDTRSWRLEPFRTAHPVVDALLVWRKAERIATTYGHGWLAANVRDGRLRGTWLGSDGAAGRMTASAGLHNLPAELRPAVAAEPGHLLVRADLGQVEPRVLAVVSGDAELARAGQTDDLYAPVADRLGVPRAVAKVAVLAAMYGQTSGTAGEALRGLTREYPVAMGYLDAAYADGWAGRDVRTFGGRLVRMPALPEGLDEDGIRGFQAGRGRYARNAVVQGAAAEFFKIWAVTVRARGAALGARIVLCLHDELLVHVLAERAPDTVALVHACLAESAARWQRQAPNATVRFVADVRVVRRWSEAKD